MVGIAQPYYFNDYIARVFDLAAYVNLVRARLELRLAAIPPDRVQAFLADAGKETKNPYDGKPFAWDPATRMLTFTPRSEHWRDWITSEPVAIGAPAR